MACERPTNRNPRRPGGSQDPPEVNLLSRDEGDRVPAAYGTNYDRLREIKREWDPENRFSTNHNIDPSES